MRRVPHWLSFRRTVQILALLLFVATGFTGCRKKRATRIPVPPPITIPSEETGVASWYGHPYHGRRTANGEVYDMDGFTAAHRIRPFNSWVQVQNLDNGLKVNVRINDRGPFVNGRIIDLSRAAARAIGMIGPGTARVRIVSIDPPPLPAHPAGAVAHSEGALAGAPVFGVQVGAFENPDNAERLRDEMEVTYGTAVLVRRDGEPPLWRVVVGRTPDSRAAKRLAERIRGEFGPAFVVRLDEELPRP